LRRSRKRGSGRDPLWYKDAVIYALHVKTFCDGNGDGVGDFGGLIDKLDYLERLGVSCLWLLPFYESPLLDDGYDIAHYERVHPAYGTLQDCRRFVAEAHARGMQVITELVINHTSDRHPWFQAARRAPAGSEKRDFYVWSDDDRRFPEARVIFHEVERSNWAWDPAAGAFYWHRFFSHQPDLNFDNPRVRRAVLKVMRFWLDIGVDGLRLDAVAHLFEREGTTCENLPETHAFLKDIRADMDRRYTRRMFLAEANQCAEETREYFGDGDECHMAFHFPLMPRLFLALKQEAAAPIIQAVEHTTRLPDACQWALFLRSHDELTLSAVTGEERELLLDAYAREPRMRLNNGIRRRLAPLLDNDPGRIWLAHALLFSLPGSPVMYYGDEIGMGDNIMLEDRDGIRTPMQWSGAPHGGFSHPETRALVLPAIDDATYGYAIVNVESQERSKLSLLSRIKRLIAVRRRHPAFGRGSIEFLDSGNPRVLALVRTHQDDSILVVANLSASPQASALHLPGPLAGGGLIELLENTRLADQGSDPYLFTLPGHACCWLQPIDSRAGRRSRRSRRPTVRSGSAEAGSR
jgi:maltose alpha-D-glucosyltransferase/alpha-amylase